MPKLTAASEAAGRNAPKTPEEVEAVHEWGAQQEALQILKLIGEALLAALNDPSVAAPGAAATK